MEQLYTEDQKQTLMSLIEEAVNDGTIDLNQAYETSVMLHLNLANGMPVDEAIVRMKALFHVYKGVKAGDIHTDVMIDALDKYIKDAGYDPTPIADRVAQNSTVH